MKQSKVWPIVKRVFCVLLLIFSLVLTVRSAWSVSRNLIDSDTASELVLSEKLAREGGIMSSSWVYSTELQVFDCHIIYSLLFRVCSDWSLVRFWGCIIMDLMMLGAMGVLFRQARIPFNRFCAAGAAILLPFSIPFGRIILYHNYYSFHIAFSFLVVGLYLGAVRRLGGRKRWPFWTVTGLMALTSFADGLGGVRPLMICMAPLFVTAVLTALRSEKDHETGAGAGRELPKVLLAAVPMAFAGAGYLVNLNVLSNMFAFKDYSGQTISLGNFATLHTVISNIFVDLGFQDYQPLFTLQGILSMCGILCWMLSLILAAHTLRRSREPAACFLQLFWLIVQLVMTCVFMFLNSEDMLHMLYLLPIIVWIVPAFAAADVREGFGVPAAEGAAADTEAADEWDAESAAAAKKTKRAKGAKVKAAEGEKPNLFLRGDSKLSVHWIAGLMGLMMLIANGVYYAGFFQDTSSMPVEYIGLQYNDTDTVKGLQPIADYLKENGYTLAYAAYWDAAVVTELSDGAVRTVPVMMGTHKHPIKYMPWLCDRNLWNIEFVEKQKVAVIANMDITSALEDFDKVPVQEVASFGGYTIFEMTDPAALARDLD